MNEPEPNADTPEKASSLHEVGRATEGQTLNRPTVEGWWWANDEHAYGWEPVLVQKRHGTHGDLVFLKAGIEDRYEVGGVKEWAGPVIPPRGPTISDRRPGDRDATKNKSSSIAGFAASDG